MHENKKKIGKEKKSKDICPDFCLLYANDNSEFWRQGLYVIFVNNEKNIINPYNLCYWS